MTTVVCYIDNGHLDDQSVFERIFFLKKMFFLF
jgi:hypothetical protein